MGRDMPKVCDHSHRHLTSGDPNRDGLTRIMRNSEQVHLEAHPLKRRSGMDERQFFNSIKGLTHGESGPMGRDHRASSRLGSTRNPGAVIAVLVCHQNEVNGSGL
jgi:hypothetical protein